MFAALATSRLLEDRTRWTIKTFVRTARRYRTIHIRKGNQTAPRRSHARSTSAMHSRASLPVRAEFCQVGPHVAAAAGIPEGQLIGSTCRLSRAGLDLAYRIGSTCLATVKAADCLEPRLQFVNAQAPWIRRYSPRPN